MFKSFQFVCIPLPSLIRSFQLRAPKNAKPQRTKVVNFTTSHFLLLCDVNVVATHSTREGCEIYQTKDAEDKEHRETPKWQRSQAMQAKSCGTVPRPRKKQTPPAGSRRSGGSHENSIKDSSSGRQPAWAGGKVEGF